MISTTLSLHCNSLGQCFVERAERLQTLFGFPLIYPRLLVDLGELYCNFRREGDALGELSAASPTGRVCRELCAEMTAGSV